MLGGEKSRGREAGEVAAALVQERVNMAWTVTIAVEIMRTSETQDIIK